MPHTTLTLMDWVGLSSAGINEFVTVAVRSFSSLCAVALSVYPQAVRVCRSGIKRTDI